MNAREYLAAAQEKTATETFRPSVDTDDARAFAVTFKLWTKPELERVLKSCSTKVRDPIPGGRVEWKEIVNPTKLREKMAERIVEWSASLTYGLLVDLGNLQAPNGELREWATKPMECSPDHAVAVMETVLGFEDWLLTRLTSLADTLSREEARAKNASAPTLAASTTT